MGRRGLDGGEIGGSTYGRGKQEVTQGWADFGSGATQPDLTEGESLAGEGRGGRGGGGRLDRRAEAGVRGALKASPGEAPAFGANVRRVSAPQCTDRTDRSGNAEEAAPRPQQSLRATCSRDHCDEESK